MKRTAIKILWLAVVILIGARAEAGEARKPSVLVVHATLYSADIQAKLTSSKVFDKVDLFNANTGTPTLSTLKSYDAVLITSDLLFADATTLGNNLADYVDAGGGVVCMAYTSSTLSASLVPQGRWPTGYLVMSPAANATGAQTLDLASITQPNHAMLIGVGSFSGGTSSYRVNQSSVVAGATILAKYGNGNVLAAAGPLPGRVDLNFYAPSRDIRSGSWDPATDGLKLMVNALLYTMRPRVLIAGAESNAVAITDVQNKVRGTGLVGITDTFNLAFGTPTLDQLRKYDAVLAWSGRAPGNPSAVGNVLADYVDAGGGVVTAMSAQLTSWSFTGRWTGAYQLLGASSPSTAGSASLGTVFDSSHPIMSGVSSFNGGSVALRVTGPPFSPGSFVIANWNDDRPLVVVSPKFANRADLNFYPVSSTVSSVLWQVGTNGDKLLANALIYVCRPNVAIAAADGAAEIDDVVAKLAATRRFSGVGQFSIHSYTPTIFNVRRYSALATWSRQTYNITSVLGGMLADYVDVGGGVVTTLFGNTTLDSPEGRWVSEGYEIVPSPLPGLVASTGSLLLGTIVEPENPLARFVRKFDGGTYAARLDAVPPLRGRTILNTSDGKMLASVHNFKKRADLGFYPISTGSDPLGWNQRTDGTWLLANALEYVVRSKPCPGDFNGDGQVDDADFVLFAGYYDALIDPRGDLSGDGTTDDGDFVVFASSYDALACP
ncbi:MAG: hypothetical protein U0573_02950 [Phycisphaerales bacterium]|nr:hypothetical protein [Planctomycetota bacterium]